MSVEQLYSDIPPTKLRNQNEEFKPAKTTPFWLWVANQFFYGMLENRFFALRYKGEENFSNRDENIPTIAFAPHTNWWDGIVGYNIIRRIFGKEIRLMVEELNRFPLLRRGGAFSVNKKSAQASMKALKYSIDETGWNPPLYTAQGLKWLAGEPPVLEEVLVEEGEVLEEVPEVF